MNTFKGAFKVALQDAGFKPEKVNSILTVWKHKDLPGRRSTAVAAVAAVRGDGQKGS